MANGYQYDNNSRSFSANFDDTGRQYNQSSSYETSTKSGFADSLESRFYFDRPSSHSEPERDYAEKDYYNTSSNARTSNVNKASYGTNSAPKTHYEPENNYEYRNSYGWQDANGYSEKDYDEFAEREREHNLNTRYSKKESEDLVKPQGQMAYTTDDASPSATTMQFSTNEVRENPFEDYRKKGEAIDKQYTINTKGKILIAVYALVVATIFALIILNTRLLKTLNATSMARQAELTRITQEVNDLNDQLEYVSSDEVIEEKAAEKGMIKT